VIQELIHRDGILILFLLFSDIEFPGWTGPDSVQTHINRTREQLPDDESKRMIDTLTPSTAVNMLHKRLAGRFRPIVTGTLF
jgi:hypothetical protein